MKSWQLTLLTMTTKIRPIFLAVCVLLLQLVISEASSYKITGGGKSKEDGEKATVELLIVCDLEWGKLFNSDREKIVSYLTLYFADVAMRFKTLPSVDISFRITGVTVMKNQTHQPFIENAKESDGKVSLGIMLDLFAAWIYREMDTLPKFDVAVAITTTKDERAPGNSHVGAPCNVNHHHKLHFGSAVISDTGSWSSTDRMAHELGHILGAPDNAEECRNQGYIMDRPSEELKWFFSPCSNNYIKEFIRSSNADCLRRLDESSEPIIDPNLGTDFAVRMDEQCKNKLECDNDEDASIPSAKSGSNCGRIRCRHNKQNKTEWNEWSMEPVQNTICEDNGRCFRGQCRPPGGLIQNVGSGRCVTSPDRFNSDADVGMADCKEYGTPFDRFSISDGQYGKLLGVPRQTPNALENGEICITTENNDGARLFFSRCNPHDKKLGWDFVDVGNGEFLLFHRLTNLCAKDVDRFVYGYVNCNKNDPNMRWKLQDRIFIQGQDSTIFNFDYRKIISILLALLLAVVILLLSVLLIWWWSFKYVRVPS